MVKTMGATAFIENNTLSMAPYAGKDTDMGKFEKAWDARAVSVCHVSQG